MDEVNPSPDDNIAPAEDNTPPAAAEDSHPEAAAGSSAESQMASQTADPRDIATLISVGDHAAMAARMLAIKNGDRDSCLAFCGNVLRELTPSQDKPQYAPSPKKRRLDGERVSQAPVLDDRMD